ncbi:MAG: OmpA family protein [Cytophagaceae bacterium]|jgi:outer membrane protein OmpA-like peptidoglycan-associated protein|nr:OmpA family protein [Cytophagaceae bacterium]
MKNLAYLVLILFVAIGAEATHSRKKYKRTYKCSQVGVKKVKAHKGAEPKSLSFVRINDTQEITARHKHHQRFLERQKKQKHSSEQKVKETEELEIAKGIQSLHYPEPVYFRFDSYQLDIIDLAQVSLASEWVKKGHTVVLIGHTDNEGSERYNQLLSISRAMHIKKLMIDMGCHADLIEVQGEGERKPQASNETVDGRLSNRRVEFIINIH